MRPPIGGGNRRRWQAGLMVLYHFSEDPTIERFVPHVPRTNPSEPPAVWAIDEAHCPLYWFPRDCPRVTAWPRNDRERPAFREAFCTAADRIQAIELGWLSAMAATVLYRYHFDNGPFRPLAQASGQWTSSDVIEPIAVEPVGDLLSQHVEADIELRAVPSLWPLHGFVQSGDWDFSIVRMSNARPRP